MAPNAWASFCAKFPEDPNPCESRCAGVGEYLATRLRQAGINVAATGNWRDSGWAVKCQIDGKLIHLFVSYYGKAPLEYILCCTSDRSLLAKFLGTSDVAARWKLAGFVHFVLAGDPRFSDIRWYHDGWFAKGDEAWCPSPMSNQLS